VTGFVDTTSLSKFRRKKRRPLVPVLFSSRIACFHDLHAAQHLTHDHFDVLVFGLRALRKVDVVRFVGDLTGQWLDTQQMQDD